MAAPLIVVVLLSVLVTLNAANAAESTAVAVLLPAAGSTAPVGTVIEAVLLTTPVCVALVVAVAVMVRNEPVVGAVALALIGNNPVAALTDAAVVSAVGIAPHVAVPEATQL